MGCPSHPFGARTALVEVSLRSLSDNRFDSRKIDGILYFAYGDIVAVASCHP